MKDFNWAQGMRIYIAESLPRDAEVGSCYFSSEENCFVIREYTGWSKFELKEQNCCVSRHESYEPRGNCPNCGAPINGDKCEYCGGTFKKVITWR